MSCDTKHIPQQNVAHPWTLGTAKVVAALGLLGNVLACVAVSYTRVLKIKIKY